MFRRQLVEQLDGDELKQVRTMPMLFLNRLRGAGGIGRVDADHMLVATDLIGHVILHEIASKSNTASGERVAGSPCGSASYHRRRGFHKAAPARASLLYHYSIDGPSRVRRSYLPGSTSSPTRRFVV